MSLPYTIKNNTCDTIGHLVVHLPPSIALVSTQKAIMVNMFKTLAFAAVTVFGLANAADDLTAVS